MAACRRALLLGLVLTALVGSAMATDPDPLNPPVTGDPVRSGLNLKKSTTAGGPLTGGIPTGVDFVGRIMDSSVTKDADTGKSLSKDLLASDLGADHAASIWTSRFTLSAKELTTGPPQGSDLDLVVPDAISMSDAALSKQMGKFLWVAATTNSTVHKIDTTNGAVVGSFLSKPALAAGNPAAIAVQSTGNAFVGNAFTFGAGEVGSLTRIRSNKAGADTVCSGDTSANDVSLPWAAGPDTSTADDTCIESFVDLFDATADAGSDHVSISAVAVDGADNVYTVAINEDVKFAGFLKVYRTAPDGATTTVLLGAGAAGYFADRATSFGPGAPGGSGAVVDKWGNLWTGGGTYRRGVSGPYILLRVNTVSGSAAVFSFAGSHETNALALDNDGNLFVSGGGLLSHLRIDPNTIKPILLADGPGAQIPVIDQVDLTAGTTGGDCTEGGVVDPCCTAGSYNTGIVVSRPDLIPAGEPTEVWVANECPAGLVRRYSTDGAAFTAIGGAFAVGAYPSTLQIDATNKVWLTTLTENDPGFSRQTLLKTITGSTVAPVSTLALPYVGGIGDMTGRYSAPLPTEGTWSFVHETGIAGYDKWDGASFAFKSANTSIPLGSTLSVKVYVSDAAVTPNAADPGNWDASEDITASSIDDADAVITGLPEGRSLMIQAIFTRGDKVGPEIGPQGPGQFPLLTEVSVLPFNNKPDTVCLPREVDGDTAASQINDLTNNPYGTSGSGRYCGAPLNDDTAIDEASYDADTAEFDTLLPTRLNNEPRASLYDPVLYKLTTVNTPSTDATLTVFDAHGKNDTCTEAVTITDPQTPVWKKFIGGSPNPDLLTSGLSNDDFPADVADLKRKCVWPPNFKYFCWLDVTSNTNDQILPLFDNCAGGYPIGKVASTYTCTDTDPRSVAGDCVLYEEPNGGGAGIPTYNMCVLGRKRTVFSNNDRVYRVNFQVTDSSKKTIATAPVYSREIRVPPLWQFQTRTDCPRPPNNDPDVTGTSAFFRGNSPSTSK